MSKSQLKRLAVQMKPVKSGAVSFIGYDSGTKTLAVQFSSGQKYHYAGVEAGDFDKLGKAESIGKHLQAHIVGKFKQEKQGDL